MKLFSVFISTLLFIASCSIQDKKSNLNGWIGKYEYNETPVQAVAGYSMVMSWQLSIEKNQGGYGGILEINGQQTFSKLSTNISGDSTRIDVLYDTLIEGTKEDLKIGDTLFTLVKTGRELMTHWASLEPRLIDSSSKSCDCFKLR